MESRRCHLPCRAWIGGSVPTPVSPEEADRIASEFFAQHGFPGYRVVRVAELPEFKKFYYVAQWNLAREWTAGDVPLGFGGLFVSLSTGEVEGPGSGAAMCACAYLRARDQLARDVEPSVQELAALLARHSWEQLIAMCEEQQRKQQGDTPGRLKAAWAWIRRAGRGR